MVLRDISLIGFKNIAEQQLSLSEGINCLVGDNGAGKTNVLDAVHYLSMAKSMLTMTDSQSVCHGSEFFMLDGRFTSDDGRAEQVCCSYSRRSGKTLKRNGKEYDRLSDHVGAFPIVVVSPSDTALISDSAEERRRYLNSFISQIDRNYLAALIRYNTALAERNKLLKTQPEESMIEIYDRMLSDSGEIIHDRRAEIVEQMTPLVEQYYALLSEDREKIDICYRSELSQRPLAELLLASRQRDLVNEYTTCGIHRDDMALGIGGYPLRKYGSQGQQKSFLIALKLAQYAVVAQEKGEKPILLLDDLFDKLDASRVEQLIRLVKGDDFGQIFISDCNPVRLQSILDRAGGGYSLFAVHDGAVRIERVDEGETAADASAVPSTTSSAVFSVAADLPSGEEPEPF